MKFNGLDIDKIMFNGLPVTSAMINGVDAHRAKIYGVSWDKSENPELTRTDDAVGMVANVGIDAQIVVNDFDTAEIFRDITEVTDSYGNVFMRIPKFYIKKTDASDLKTWQVSKKPFTGAYLPKCFWDFANNKELPYVDIGKHIASLSDDGTRLESKPGKYPLVNTTIVQFRELAKANGIGYQQLDIHAIDLLQTLFIIEQATLDSQSKVAGYTSGQYENTHLAVVAENNTNRIIVPNATAALYEVGQAISVGTSRGGNQIFYGRTITAIELYDADNKAIVFDGSPVNIAIDNVLYNTGYKTGFSANIAASVGSINSNSSGKHSFVWHGIESIYGDVLQLVDGLNINDCRAWVCENADQYASNVFASPYKQLVYTNANTNGYVKAMGVDPNIPYAELPIDVTGTDTKYYSDYYYQNSGQYVAHAGGYWRSGSTAGLFYWPLDNLPGDASMIVGGRLLRKAI